MPSGSRVVIGGVDTHKDVHVAALIDAPGRILATAELLHESRAALATSRLDALLRRASPRSASKGTGAYGAGLARHLSAAGVPVLEVNRPNRQARRRRGSPTPSMPKQPPGRP